MYISAIKNHLHPNDDFFLWTTMGAYKSYLSALWNLNSVWCNARPIHSTKKNPYLHLYFVKTNWGKTKFQFTWKKKTSFPPALASRCMFINPKVLFDLTPTIHQFSSAIITGPYSVPQWVGRKTYRIRFRGRQMHCTSEVAVYTSIKNVPFSVVNFPKVCDCIYNGHCQKSNLTIKPGSRILQS